MRFSLLVAILAGAVSLSAHAQFGAKRFKFEATADTNAIVPAHFTNRDYVPVKTVAAAGGDITWFPGRVVYKDSNGDWVFLPVVTKGAPAWTVIIKPVPYSFHTNINRDYKGSFKIPAVDISSSMENAYDYEIRDVATVNVPDENVPDSDAVKTAAAARFIPDTTPLFWVASVTLTTVSVKTAAEVQSGGTITGVGFSTGASTYNASSAASFTPLLCLGTMPMNEAAVKQTLNIKQITTPTTPPATAATSSILKKKLSEPFVLEEKDAKAFAKFYAAKLTPGGGVITNAKAATQ